MKIPDLVAILMLLALVFLATPYYLEYKKQEVSPTKIPVRVEKPKTFESLVKETKE